MERSKKRKTLIFDMDNTLIRSAIDFPRMKREVAALFEEAGIKIDLSLPVVKAIRAVEHRKNFTKELEQKVWQLILEIELTGMSGAVREEGVIPVLERCREAARLAVITNNHYEAAKKALENGELLPYFERVLGRGTVPDLKPEPGGFLFLLQELDCTVEDCLAIGDARIDLEAATAAGIRFIAYNGSRREDWEKMPIRPMAYIQKWDDEAADLILALLQEG